MRTAKFVFLSAALGAALFNTSALATFPGQNGKFVFQSDRSGSWQLYTIDPDGSNLMQLTQMAPTDQDLWVPSFSPDGKQIAFCYGADGVSEIYVINADGTALKQLTHDGLFACSARWSPDGQYIVFSETFAPTGAAVIKVMRSDGSGEETTLTTGEWEFWDSYGPPIFTPNGREIVFESQFGGVRLRRVDHEPGWNEQTALNPCAARGSSVRCFAGRHSNPLHQSRQRASAKLRLRNGPRR
jgi:Tol biopolymer transport system component